MLASRLETLLSAHVRDGQTLVVGFSGGLDSSVLLHALAQLGRWPVAACHVHHGLSPNADAWAEHCRATAALWNVPCTVLHVQVPRDTGSGLEAAARNERHRALATTSGDWLVLAHHQGDQAETVLGNLLRGTGVLGLAGMPVRSGRILRPLLDVSRRELEAHAHAHALRWIEDESNADLHYTRNWLRHRALPLLSERYEQAEARLAQTAAHAGEAHELLLQLAQIDAGAEGENGLCFPMPLATLKALDFPRALNLLRALLTTHQLQAPPAVRLSEFLRQCREAAPDRHPALDTPQWRLHVKARQLWLDAKVHEPMGHPKP